MTGDNMRHTSESIFETVKEMFHKDESIIVDLE
jgi:hypothetical protein